MFLDADWKPMEVVWAVEGDATSSKSSARRDDSNAASILFLARAHRAGHDEWKQLNPIFLIGQCGDWLCYGLPP
jgi:hypothetical protein